MDMDKLVSLAPILFSGLAVIGSAFAYFSGGRQREADEAETLTDTALALVTKLREEVARTQNEMARTLLKIDGLQAHVEQQEKNSSKLEERYKLLHIDFRHMEDNLQKVRRELTVVEVERDNLALRVATLTDEIKELTKMNIKLLAQITTLQGNIKELTNKNVM